MFGCDGGCCCCGFLLLLRVVLLIWLEAFGYVGGIVICCLLFGLDIGVGLGLLVSSGCFCGWCYVGWHVLILWVFA